MNLEKLQSKLITAARAARPSDAVPLAFEKRIMARLRAVRPVDAWSVWGGAMWRAAVPCFAVMLLCVAWATVSSMPDEGLVTFEETMLASVAETGAWE